MGGGSDNASSQQDGRNHAEREAGDAPKMGPSARPSWPADRKAPIVRPLTSSLVASASAASEQRTLAPALRPLTTLALANARHAAPAQRASPPPAERSVKGR